MHSLSCYAFSISAAAAMLAACGGSQPPIAAPGATAENVGAPTRAAEHRVRLASSYEVLYRFPTGRTRRPRGEWPYAPLIAVNGTMYGTTYAGGTKCRPGGCGTVYSISASGSENVIYRFVDGGNDGYAPTAGLLDVNGTLYGTTNGYSNCRYSACGTVYSVSPSGMETVLHKFTGAPYDGSGPNASLIDVNGTLYGTTYAGGTHDCGTVFSITSSGSERVLYAFSCGKDGDAPIGLVDVNGTLYGAAFDRGSGCKPQGCGLVYSLGTDGSKKTLHFFRGGSEGRGPNAALVYVNGALYGTTEVGGSFQGNQCFIFGCGTVFKMSLDGRTKVLYRFAGGVGDGAFPQGLLYMNGTFYGTTANGGSSVCAYDTYNSCGTVYSLSHAGEETVLHAFTDVPDGGYPRSELIDLNGTLYGTTSKGGDQGCFGGCGTVFALTP